MAAVTLPGTGEDVAVDVQSDGDKVQRFTVGARTAKLLTNVPVSVSSSGDNALVTATASQTTRVFRVLLVAAAAVSIKFRSATTDRMGAIPLAAGGSLVLDFDGEPWFETAINEALNLNLSAAVAVTGFIQYEKSVP